VNVERLSPDTMSDDPSKGEPLRDGDNPPEEGSLRGGQATSAGGGYGVGSDRGSGGTGEGTRPAGEDVETEWLRKAHGGPHK